MCLRRPVEDMPPTLQQPVPPVAPVIIAPVSDTTEARLKALEDQRDHDHGYLLELANAIAYIRSDTVAAT